MTDTSDRATLAPFSVTPTPLNNLPNMAAPSAELVLTITAVDPRAMACTYTIQTLPNGAVTACGPFDVGATNRTFLDFDLTKLGLQVNQYLRVKLQIADTNAIFVQEAEMSVMAGDNNALAVMYKPSTGTYTSNTVATFFCRFTDNSPDLLPYNVSMWLLHSTAGSNFRMQVSFDPKIKNNG